MLAIKLLVNPPCQHTQQPDDNDGAKNGSHNRATAVTLHHSVDSLFPSYFPFCGRDFKEISDSLAKIIKLHTFSVL